MLNKIFKREKPRLWLGTVAVAPRNDVGRHFDEWSIFAYREDLDTSLRKTLESIFDFPLASGVIKPESNDYSLDIIVPKFQSGDSLGVSLVDIGFPLFWRPKLEIGARLVNLKSGKTVYTTTVKAKLRWRNYFARLFSLRGILRFSPLFDANDMNHLLYEACLALLPKLRKAI